MTFEDLNEHDKAAYRRILDAVDAAFGDDEISDGALQFMYENVFETIANNMMFLTSEDTDE